MVHPAPLPPYETTWESWVLGGGVRQAFADPDLPLQVEIGPGDDGFLLESALRDGGCNWLGIEYSRKRVRRYVRRIQQKAPRLGNLRLVWRPAADIVGPFLSPAVVAGYHVYFPDPWPKAHHARYRMVTAQFAADLRESLVAGGSVRLATDSEAYAEEILLAFGQVPGMVNALPCPGWARSAPGETHTVFAERWRTAGRQILVLEFHRRA